jgi:hypothetical protein
MLNLGSTSMLPFLASPPHLREDAVSVAASGCVCVGERDRGQYGTELATAYSAGGRLQYDRRLGGSWYLGGAAAFEAVARAHETKPRYVGLVGAVTGWRWGDADPVRGGVRFAAGVAYADGLDLGVHIDIDGEVSSRVGPTSEVVLGFGIVNARYFFKWNFTPTIYQREPTWFYANAVVPLMLTVAVRTSF